MKSILFVLLAIFTSFSNAGDINSFSREMMFFYMEPSKAGFEEFQSSTTEFKEELKKSEIIVSVMIARISTQHNWPISEGAFAAAARDIQAGRTELAQFVGNDDQVNPLKLDIWWASFFATGDEVYLEKILKFAGEKMLKGDLAKTMVIGAATWSFKSNCNQHRAVKEFAVKMSTNKSLGSEKIKYLKECIE